ncbi:YadA family autotransporter adhesin [Burkholderia ubonensis]|uniref:YadA family autotransporter adhesin n=1 Tax=Burkholderia ubonensis TaxID=101571 RepID=UPI0009B3F7B8
MNFLCAKWTVQSDKDVDAIQQRCLVIAGKRRREHRLKNMAVLLVSGGVGVLLSITPQAAWSQVVTLDVNPIAGVASVARLQVNASSAAIPGNKEGFLNVRLHRFSLLAPSSSAFGFQVTLDTNWTAPAGFYGSPDKTRSYTFQAGLYWYNPTGGVGGTGVYNRLLDDFYLKVASTLPTAIAAGTNSVAIGGASVAGGASSVAMGASSQALAASTVALGAGNVVAASAGAGSIAAGHNSRVLGGTGAVAMGESQVASGNGAVAIGDPNSATGTGAIAVGANNSANGQGAVALGNGNTANGQGSVAVGNTSRAQAAGALALGDSAVAANAGDVALGKGSTTTAAIGTTGTTINGVTYGFAGTAPISTVSVGTTGGERTITNVAAGRLSATSTDAVNGSQLYATNQAVQQLSNGVQSVNSRIDSVARDADGGSAAAIAIAGLPQPTAPGHSMVSAGASVFRGQTGYALGLSRVTDNGRWVVKGAVTTSSRNQYGGQVSAGYQW